jgi:hypothetical protein
VSASPQPPAPAGQLSPDGFWWWDGTRWLPVAQPVYQQPQPAPRTPRPRPPWLKTTAGVAAIAGTVATLVACVVPYGAFPDPSGGPTTSSSIFNGGFVGAGWDMPEPVFVIVVGVVAAILVLALTNKAVQAISTGLLLAAGAQTATMWLAYVGLAGSEGSVQPGGVIGLVGALLLLIAGLLALANLLMQPTTTPAPTTPKVGEAGGS